MVRRKLKDPPSLPELSGAKLLGRICLHPTQSSRQKAASFEKDDDSQITRVTAQPPSADRLREEARGRRGPLADRFSRFLLSHRGDRPWRRAEGELPLWDPNAALSNKAAILTAKIANEFCEWYRGLGGTAIIDEPKIQALFDIHFPEPARGATRVDVRVLRASEVPGRVLQAATRDSGLLMAPSPLPAVQKEAVRVAFGRCVPRSSVGERPPCRAPPLPEPPADLLSMATVFRDITHLQVTRGFCKVLKETPGATRPSFLVEAGLVPPATKVHRKRDDKAKRRASSHNPPWTIFK